MQDNGNDDVSKLALIEGSCVIQELEEAYAERTWHLK